MVHDYRYDLRVVPDRGKSTLSLENGLNIAEHVLHHQMITIF